MQAKIDGVLGTFVSFAKLSVFPPFVINGNDEIDTQRSAAFWKWTMA
jgi:hypothetical protein